MTPEQDRRLADWMRQAQSGEKSAYNQLLKEAAAFLKRFFASRAESGESADDLVQETLISVHRARHTFMDGRPFAPWMYAIARRRLADHWRSRARLVPSEALDETLDWVDSREPVAEGVSDSLKETLAQLTEGQRRVVELLKIEGLSVRECARKLDMSEAAVKVAAHRAYERLRRTLSQGNNENR